MFPRSFACKFLRYSFLKTVITTHTSHTEKKTKRHQTCHCGPVYSVKTCYYKFGSFFSKETFVSGQFLPASRLPASVMERCAPFRCGTCRQAHTSPKGLDITHFPILWTVSNCSSTFQALKQAPPAPNKTKPKNKGDISYVLLAHLVAG